MKGRADYSVVLVSQQGFEPWTKRLRVSCSTAELLARSKWYRRASSTINRVVHQCYPLACEPRPLLDSLISFSVSPTLRSLPARAICAVTMIPTSFPPSTTGNRRI